MAPDRIPSWNVDDLLAGCAAGDSRALRNLYDLMSAQIFGIALRILRDRHAAKDVLHEVFVQIWRQAGKFDSRVGSSRAWIVSIARYRSIDRVRMQEQEVATAMPFPVQETASPPSALPDASGHQKVRRLYSCMSGLPEKARRAVTLAFLDGLSHEQVSTVVNAPAGTVKSWIRQGLLRLEECLKSHGH